MAKHTEKKDEKKNREGAICNKMKSMDRATSRERNKNK